MSNNYIAGDVYDGTFRLASVLANDYGVEEKIVRSHTNTLVSISAFSDGMPPSAVHFQGAELGTIGIEFKNPELGRKLIIWLGKGLVSTEVKIEMPDRTYPGNDINLKRYFEWLREGMPTRNHARLKVMDLERMFHAPFACGWYKLFEKGKEKPIKGNRIIREKTIKDVFDKFRKIYPDENKHILVINALKRTGEKPNDIGEICLQAAFLEKAFYHGG